jgi:EmrB/QacA subfamily drug resistance transporter
VFASLMLAAGTLGDRLGRKRLMVAGVGVFAAGSLLGALAPNVSVLIAARGIMGIGAAASEPGTLSVIRHVYPERSARARALGIWAATSGLALALGPVFGGVLVGLGGWRNVFWFNLAAGIVLLGLAAARVPESADPQPGAPDIVGFILAPLALGTVTFGVILGESHGYTSPAILTLFVAGMVAGALFVLNELRSPEPMLDLRYLRKAPFSGALIVAFAAYFGIFSIFFFTALYLEVVLGYSGFRIAVLFLPMAAAMIIASVLTGRWVSRGGPRLPMALGCLLAGLGILLADVALRGSVDFVVLAGTLALGGLGFGIAVVPITAVALAVIPPQHSGMAASATTTSRELGSVVGVAVLGALVNGYLTTHLSHRLQHLGVPTSFQGIVITAVEQGQVPGGKSAAAAEKAYGPLVAKVIDAAYAAFHAGLSVSLIVAGVVILIAGLVAWLTLRPTPRPHLASRRGAPGRGR